MLGRVTIRQVILDRPKLSGLVCFLVCRGLCELGAMSLDRPAPDQVADADSLTMLSAGIAAIFWLLLLYRASRGVPVVAGAPPFALPGGLVRVIFVMALVGLPVGAARIGYRLTLPDIARPSVLEARFVPELERLTSACLDPQAFRHPRTAVPQEALFARTGAVLEARIWRREEKRLRDSRGLYVDTTRGRDGASSWLHLESEKPGSAVANLWTSPTRRAVEYERALRKAGKEVIGITLFVDLDALERAAPK